MCVEKSNNSLVAGEPGQDWASFGKSLLGAGGASLDLFADTGTGANGHTKIGAGHKPQPYDEHGRYTGPGGESAGQGARMYESEPGASPEGDPGEGSGSPEEAGAAVAEGLELTNILLADSGRVASDAGAGLFGGSEVRGPVTGEVRDPVPPPPAEVTWKNDDPKKLDPLPEDLKPQMRETVEGLRANNPQMDSFNVDSGRRPDERTQEEIDAKVKIDPHADGRAVDINKVNGIPVKDLADPKTPAAERAQEAAKNMVEQAKDDPNVNQILGPNNCWEKDKFGNWRTLDPEIPRDRNLIEGHKDHYHINVRRK